MTFKKAIPILYSSDIVQSLNYYVDVLGFDSSWKWDDPPTFGAAIKDNVEIFFAKGGQGNKGTWLSLFLNDVDAYYERIKASGAKIICAPENMDWGIREMLVEDPDGHRLRIGQNSLKSDKEIIDAAMPPNIRITARIPSPSEVNPVIKAIGWVSHDHESSQEMASPAIVHAVVAEDIDNNNEVVGCVFLLSDQVGFYYVKSLIVHPRWQHKRIGSALMRELMQWIEENTISDAAVYLHTGEALNEFYSQFGFGPAFGMYRLVKKKK